MDRWPICPDVALAVPVVQAPLGSCDGPRLAAAVSRAGGLGCLSLFDHTPDAARRLLRRTRHAGPRTAGTRRPVLVALTRQWEPEAVLDACIDSGVRLFYVFWWNGPRLAGRIRRAGGRVFWQVGSRAQAVDAAQNGADVLVAQGIEAGGPVRGHVPLRDLVPAVIEATGLPVVGGGGLADRADVRGVLALGARAALLGTRFVASEESAAPAAYKASLRRAGPDDLFLDTRHIGSWPCAPSRCIGAPGDEDDFRCFAGAGVGRIGRIAPAAEIVRALDPRPYFATGERPSFARTDSVAVGDAMGALGEAGP